jgi:pSer/pThr/pTyr-binding forkhead associated (FHA) protein
VTDLSSRNGTFVNGGQVHGTVRLHPGDHLLVGATVLELRTPGQIAGRPSATVPVPAGLTRRSAGAPAVDPVLPIGTGRPAGLLPLGVAMVLVLVVLLLASR